MYGDEAPITAFATTPGNSAITLIRCSGKNSIEMVSSVFSSDKIKDAQGNSVVYGWITGNEKTVIANMTGGTEVPSASKIDEVLISVFRAPKSYTGEDSLDICCHGGNAAGKAVMDALKSAGFRDALPGEFTFRAFMNGKLDLTQCESVMELVSAKTETGRSHAVSRLSGALQNEINEIKQLLIQVLASAEIYLDYSEDEIGPALDSSIMDSSIMDASILGGTAGKLPNQEIALTALSRLKKLSASWQLERIYQEGVTIVIAGRPNAGKSSLFNLLLKEDRSIVTPIPGTTRDWIEAWVSIEGIPIRLVDTAGLRESADSVEKIGVERSLKLLEEAEVVLYLIDGQQGVTAEDRDFLERYAIYSVPGQSTTLPKSGINYLWSKSDLSLPPLPFPIKGVSPICVSAKANNGIEELYSVIIKEILRQTTIDVQLQDFTAGLGTIRQKNLVDAACSALEDALAMAESKEPLDLIALIVRDAVNSLGEITGEVSTADIIEEMFSKFCVGK